MPSRILSGLVQEKDKFCPCAFAKELYESTPKLNHFINLDFCTWLRWFNTQIRWSLRFIFTFLMISKIIKSHWKSAMYCYCLFPIEGSRALHSYLTKQKIYVDHVTISISHDDYLFISNGSVSFSDLFQVCMSRKPTRRQKKPPSRRSNVAKTSQVCVFFFGHVPLCHKGCLIQLWSCKVNLLFRKLQFHFKVKLSVIISYFNNLYSS